MRYAHAIIEPVARGANEYGPIVRMPFLFSFRWKKASASLSGDAKDVVARRWQREKTKKA